MNLTFESYWKNEGRYLDLVNRNLNKEEELKKFASEVFASQENLVQDLYSKISDLENEAVTNKKYCNC